MSDRVRSNWHRPLAWKSAGFAASECAAWTGTLFGTGSVMAKSFGQAVGLKNPANLLVQTPCAGFLFGCYSHPELLDPLLLEENDVEQLAHRRRVFGLRDVGQRDRDGPTLPIIRPSHPGAVAFLRSGHQAVWGR